MADEALVDAYDTRTGGKLPNQVPKHWVSKGSPFPYLAETPTSRAAGESDGGSGGQGTSDPGTSSSDPDASTTPPAETTTRKGK